MTPLVYTVAEVCQLLRWSRSTIYRGIQEGTIPVVRTPNGRGVRVPAWWVEEVTRAAA